MVRRVEVVQKRFKKGAAAAPLAPPLNPPLSLLILIGLIATEKVSSIRSNIIWNW